MASDYPLWLYLDWTWAKHLRAASKSTYTLTKYWQYFSLSHLSWKKVWFVILSFPYVWSLDAIVLRCAFSSNTHEPLTVHLNMPYLKSWIFLRNNLNVQMSKWLARCIINDIFTLLIERKRITSRQMITFWKSI